MRIKDNYVLQRIADEFLVVPIAEEADRLHGVIKLNEAGAYLWELLSGGLDSQTDLADALVSHFKIDLESARNDVDSYLQQLKNIGCLE